jgi:hypothetical protein
MMKWPDNEARFHLFRTLFRLVGGRLDRVAAAVAKGGAAPRTEAGPPDSPAGVVPLPEACPAFSVRAPEFGFQLVHAAALGTDHGPQLVGLGTVADVEGDAEAQGQETEKGEPE